MKKPTSVTVVNYVEEGYGASKPAMGRDQRGDERSLQCVFALGIKTTVDVDIAEVDAARTKFSLYLLFPDCGVAPAVHTREADLWLTRRQLLALPSMLRSAIREGEKIGMFDRGPSLWVKRELSTGETS